MHASSPEKERNMDSWTDTPEIVSVPTYTEKQCETRGLLRELRLVNDSHRCQAEGKTDPVT